MMQVALIGIGSFDQSVAISLCRLGGQVLAIDRRAAPVDEIKDLVSQAVVADATDEKALRALGVAEVDAAVVAIGEMAQSVVTTLLLRKIGVAKIIARALTDAHAQVLTEIGASRVINIEQQMGEQIARTLIAPHIMNRFAFGEGISLVETMAPRTLVGKKISETKLREHYHLNLVALQKREPDIDEQGKRIVKLDTDAAPNASAIIEEGHVLILAGRDEDLDSFLKKG